MAIIEDSDTRYFIEIELASLKIVRVAIDDKQNLDKGQQTNPLIHRLFITQGQYHKFVQRCHSELQPVLKAQ